MPPFIHVVSNPVQLLHSYDMQSNKLSTGAPLNYYPHFWYVILKLGICNAFLHT